MDRTAIGIFDSGIGGLTVLQALRERLPNHPFIYFGDTARVPYGRKPSGMVRTFAYEIAGFLEQLGVSAIVVACNTASACAMPELGNSVAVPVWDVVGPGVEAARRVTKSGNVGVLGTEATISRGVYQEKLTALGLRVWARACPMLVHVVEEGLATSREAELLVRHYLADRPVIDTLLLGCTHYPVLSPVIQKVVGEAVTLVSSAEVLAETVSLSLNSDSLQGGGQVVYYVSGSVAAFQHSSQTIGGLNGRVVPVDVARLSHERVNSLLR